MPPFSSEEDLIYKPEVAAEYSKSRELFNETDEKLFSEIHILGVNGKVIVDFGCGDGRHLLRLKEEGAARVIGVDINPKMIEMAKQNSAAVLNTDFMVSNGKQTPLEAESADLVVSNFMIHYFEDAQEIFNEISRVLKEGGHCVCTFNVTDVAPGSGHLYNTPMPIRLGSAEKPVMIDNLIKSSTELQVAINEAGLVIEKGDVLHHPNAVVDDSFEHKNKVEKHAVMLVLRKLDKAA